MDLYNIKTVKKFIMDLYNTKNIKTVKNIFIISAVIFSLSFLCFVFLFPYLVGTHYPFKQWTAGERLAFIIFLSAAVLFGIFTCCFDWEISYLERSASTVNGVYVAPQLIELNEIIYPNDNFDFPRLKVK